MSYILDALKKAESERKLGTIPNVYAQPMPNAILNADASNRRARLPWLLALCMFALLVAGIAWLQPWRARSAPVADVAAPRSPAVQIDANPVPLSPLPVAPAMVPANNTPIRADIPKTASVPAPLAMKSIGPQYGNPSKSANSTKRSVKLELPAEANPKPPADAAEEKQIGTLQDLPENIQRELPVVAVNGYIYAKNPADRSVLINKRLLHEGDQIVPELVLEKMMPRSAILNYKGYRYRISY